MNKITYTFTNGMKQIFLGMFGLYYVLQFIVMLMVKLFNIKGSAEQIMLVPSLLMYGGVFILLYALLISYKSCFSYYDDSTLTYENRITKKKRSIALDDIRVAIFDKRDIKLYKSASATDSDKPDFVIPFYRMGIPNAVEVDKFFRLMKNNPNVRVAKNFKVLFGYSKPWKFLKAVYALLAIAAFTNLSIPFYTIVVLLQNQF